MSTTRLTITLPEPLGRAVRKEARRQKKPISRLVVEALEAQEQERVKQLMIEGAIASREENLKIAEEFWPIAGETLPRD
jgi:hypothetical protein